MLASVKLALEQCETPSESQRVLQEFETARGVVDASGGPLIGRATGVLVTRALAL